MRRVLLTKEVGFRNARSPQQIKTIYSAVLSPPVLKDMDACTRSNVLSGSTRRRQLNYSILFLRSAVAQFSSRY